MTTVPWLAPLCVGTQPCGAGELAQVARGLASAGYDGVELHPGQLTALADCAHREGFLGTLQAAELRVACAFVGVASDAASIALANAHCEMAAALGADVVFVVPPSRRSGTLQEMADKIGRVCRAAGELGLEVAVHNHAGTHVTTVESALRFLDAVDRPEVGLCLDVAHLALFEEDLRGAVDQLLPYVVYVHIKDLAEGAREMLAQLDGESLEGVAPLTPAYTDIGAGALDLPRLLEAFASGGYRRWATIEIETLRYTNFLEQARDNAVKLKTLLATPN